VLQGTSNQFVVETQDIVPGNPENVANTRSSQLLQEVFGDGGYSHGNLLFYAVLQLDPAVPSVPVPVKRQIPLTPAPARNAATEPR
jgi:hypothetical protein